MKICDRSMEKELMDLGPSCYTPKEYEDCLHQLDRVGRYLGGDRASYWAFRQLKSTPKSILDVGCGGGLFTIRLAKTYPEAKVVGIDVSQEAIAIASKHLQNAKPVLTNLEFTVPAAPELHYKDNAFDVVIATLVCHHLTDTELVVFLKDAYKVAKQAVILNDLHRHDLAYKIFGIIAPLLFRNRLITEDGLLSIKRSFIRKDWIALLQAAEIPLEHCSINWSCPFRWIVMLNKPAAA